MNSLRLHSRVMYRYLERETPETEQNIVLKSTDYCPVDYLNENKRKSETILL